MKRHCENGLAVAKALEADSRVSWVNYPGLKSSKYYQLSQKYLPNGSCGVVSFGIKGGRAAAEKFMKELKICAIETHVADARSCCLHPANATHRQMNEEELIAAGVPSDLIRLSCGLENYNDLIDDIKSALEKI
jgi:O-acetylhomoserine (thiol)-lyase